MRRTLSLVVALIGLCGVIGCGNAGMHEVTGTVTLDSKPLEQGDIRFTPADPKFGSEESKVKDGAYKFTAREGKMKVEIRSYREVPGLKGPMGTEAVLESIIPAGYNDKTTLSAEVGPGKTKFDFTLKSK